MTVVLETAADGDRSALRVRPWLAADMPDLQAAMAFEYPTTGLGTHPDVAVPGPQRWSGPRNDQEAVLWLSGQDRGWECGDWLTFAVLDASQNRVVGHVGLWNRDGGKVGIGERGEIGYWTAAGARGRGVAPAAGLAVTAWAVRTFCAARLWLRGVRIDSVRGSGHRCLCLLERRMGGSERAARARMGRHSRQQLHRMSCWRRPPDRCWRSSFRWRLLLRDGEAGEVQR